MEEHLHVQEESRFGSEAVVYSFVSEEGKHLFHVFPIDEEGDIIDEKVRTEDMTDRTSTVVFHPIYETRWRSM